MVQPEGEPNSQAKGKAVVVASSEDDLQPKAVGFNCPRCDKTFYSAPALCGHQNAHRLVKNPMKMSPVLAAVLNNPPPPHDKPVLIPKPVTPRPHPPKLKVTKRAHCVPDQAGTGNPRYHPYPKQQQQEKQKEPVQDQPQVDLSEEVNSNSIEINPNEAKKKAGGETDKERFEDETESHTYLQMQLGLVPVPVPVPDDHHHKQQSTEVMVVEEHNNSSPYDDQTQDLLREWRPLSRVHYHAKAGKASTQTLSAAQNPPPINLRNLAMEDGEADSRLLGLQLGLRTTPVTTVHLDLRLKLGF